MIELDDVKAPDPATGRPPWEDPQYLADADDWISRACAQAGLTRVGPAQARCRMWSVVARVPVDGGQVWFKANPPGSAFEPVLGHALNQWSPQDAPPVLAVDPDRAWALTAHVGQRLDAVFAADRDVRHWFAPLRRYARLQIMLAGRLPDLADLGVPQMPLETLSDQAAAMFEDRALIETIDGPGGPTREQFDAARARLPLLREQCTELAGLGVPISIDHSDLHPGNMLGSGEQARPFDWGDAFLGHPFGSLLVILRSAPEFCGIPRGGPEIAALQAAYLEPWIDHGIDEDVARRDADLALSTGALARSASWLRMFPCYQGNVEPRANAARWLCRLGTPDPLADFPTT